MDEHEWPSIDKAFIDMLDDLIPESCPSLDDDERQIWFNVGQRQVVRMLRAIYDEQQEPLQD